ncbi:MAG TPA: DUF5106 domain-containing protein, partial [Bacteroidia bacterium]|nr:DUF5106 domain-containing protein [Bacteroidia bacterium]
MKRFIPILLAFNLLPLITISQSPAKKVEPLDLKMHINGLSGGYMLLAHYYADQNRILDTGWVDTKGNVHFKRDSAAPGGVYLVVFPSKRPFEIIIADEQKFSIDVPDTNDIVNTIKINGSKENLHFYEYHRFIAMQRQKVEPLQNAMKSARERKNKDSIELLTKQIAAIDSTVKLYIRDFYRKKHPETFLSKILAATDEPEVIPYHLMPRKADGTIDSAYNYWNLRNHYWDGFDFSDDRMIRTQVYYQKVKFYLEKLTPQHPDSITKNCIWLIEKSRASKELFKWSVSWLTYHYESSMIMGYDAIFVKLVDRYYKTGEVTW